MRQENTQTDSFDEASPLMIAAESANRIDDLIHLPQRHAIHLLVELMEVRSYLLIVVGIVFVVALVEHGQDRFAVSEAGWIRFDMRLQALKLGIHGNTPPKMCW